MTKYEMTANISASHQGSMAASSTKSSNALLRRLLAIVDSFPLKNGFIDLFVREWGSSQAATDATTASISHGESYRRAVNFLFKNFTQNVPQLNIGGTLNQNSNLGKGLLGVHQTSIRFRLCIGLIDRHKKART
jgi:hypothetical protein